MKHLATWMLLAFLMWNPNPSEENVIRYNIYKFKNIFTPLHVGYVGSKIIMIPLLHGGIYAISAVDQAGNESPLSSVVFYLKGGN